MLEWCNRNLSYTWVSIMSFCHLILRHLYHRRLYKVSYYYRYNSNYHAMCMVIFKGHIFCRWQLQNKFHVFVSEINLYLHHRIYPDNGKNQFLQTGKWLWNLKLMSFENYHVIMQCFIYEYSISFRQGSHLHGLRISIHCVNSCEKQKWRHMPSSNILKWSANLPVLESIFYLAICSKARI